MVRDQGGKGQDTVLSGPRPESAKTMEKLETAELKSTLDFSSGMFLNVCLFFLLLL